MKKIERSLSKSERNNHKRFPNNIIIKYLIKTQTTNYKNLYINPEPYTLTFQTPPSIAASNNAKKDI